MLGDGSLGLRYYVLSALSARRAVMLRCWDCWALASISTPTDRVRGDQKLGQSLCKNFVLKPKLLSPSPPVSPAPTHA